MESTKVEKKEAGCLAFVIAGMSFIPLVGVLFGIIAIIWGFVIKNTKLKIVGTCGIAFTIVIYGSLAYFGFIKKGGIYDELRAELVNTQLTSVVQAIEFYKVQNGHYPESLEILQNSLPENSMVILYDVAQVNTNPLRLYYYKIINENSYHIRSYGRDGVLNTEDDILPAPIANIGLIVDYQVQSD